MSKPVRGPNGVIYQVPDDATDDEIAAILESEMKPAAPRKGENARAMFDQADKNAIDRAKGLPGAIREHPVEAAATVGAMAAAPFTAGMSIPAAAALTGLSAAGGAGGAIAGRQLLSGKPEDPGQSINTMARQGLVNAAGEAGGRGVIRLAEKAVPVALERLVAPASRLLDEFPDVMKHIRRERIPIGASATARGEAKAAAGETDRLLFARDQSRPKVAGLLTEGNPQIAVPMGSPRIAGEMPGALVPAHSRVDPHVTDATTHRMAFDSRPLPVDLPPAPELGGPGTRMVPAPKQPPGRGAYPGQVDPRKIVVPLAKTRGALRHDPLGEEKIAQLNELQERFLAGRPDAMNLTDTKALVRSAQKNANTAYRAAEKGTVPNDVPASFQKGIAAGGNRELHKAAPEIIPHDKRAQEMIGVTKALRMAEARAAQNPPNLIKPSSWITPKMQTKAAFGVDKYAPMVQSRPAIAGRQALLSALAEALFGPQGGK